MENDFSHANAVRDEFCLELIGHASELYSEADKCHSKSHKKDLNHKARKLELMASIIHGGFDMKNDMKIEKAILFLALYSPSDAHEIDKVIDKVKEVSDKLYGEEEENKKEVLTS